jgi:hypothetical protein
MAELTIIEKRKLERLLDMGGGYVLDFSNRTFAEFFADTVRVDIYQDKYSQSGGSKANLMRGFWQVEGNHGVGRLLQHLADYVEAEIANHDRALLADCRTISDRLLRGAQVIEAAALAEIGEAEEFEAVASGVRDAINRNEPATGLDRLHTFATKYLRTLCQRRGVTVDRGKALHSLMGEYRRVLHDGGLLKSPMTAKILKSSAQLLQDFNDVRNNESLAHDNPILNHDEALLIFNHVVSTLRFVLELEKRLEREARAARQPAAAPSLPKIDFDDEIPF